MDGPGLRCWAQPSCFEDLLLQAWGCHVTCFGEMGRASLTDGHLLWALGTFCSSETLARHSRQQVQPRQHLAPWA